MTRQIAGVAAAVILSVSPALQAQENVSPQNRPVRINRIEHREAYRIRRGIHNEELTRLEATRLIHEQQRIRRQEARAKSDGELTLNERRRLLMHLNRASRHIYRDTHDRR
jgi:hypothetical protein